MFFHILFFTISHIHPDNDLIRTMLQVWNFTISSKQQKHGAHRSTSTVHAAHHTVLDRLHDETLLPDVNSTSTLFIAMIPHAYRTNFKEWTRFSRQAKNKKSRPLTAQHRRRQLHLRKNGWKD